VGGKGGGQGKGGEMIQTMYAHMNKIKIKKTKKPQRIPVIKIIANLKTIQSYSNQDCHFGRNIDYKSME
jgi:hypothetical protein